MASDAVTLPFATVMRTCTLPYWVLIAVPVYVPELAALDVVAAGVADVVDVEGVDDAVDVDGDELAEFVGTVVSAAESSELASASVLFVLVW